MTVIEHIHTPLYVHESWGGQFEGYCRECNEDYVVSERDPEQIVFVNCYTISRQYGGPEEGGWWWDWYECHEAKPVRAKYAERWQAALQSKYEREEKYGNISSVLGGLDVAVFIEDSAKESETTETPHYE